MMKDLIVTSAAFLVGTGGLISMGWVYKKLPEWNRRRYDLERMTDVQLHCELTRCVGAIATCARKGDKRGMHHAWWAILRVIRVWKKRKPAHRGL